MDTGTADENVDARETRVARRLRRLFRIERIGGFERRSLSLVQQLIERREKIIDDLIVVEAQRRRDDREASLALMAAMTDLALEVGQSREPAAAQLRRLEAELRRANGAAGRSGLRNTARGRLLGRG